VVVRQNWLKAYDFVTDRAAVTLNEYARNNDPFAKVGRESVAVEVTSLVRASESSFQVRWLERLFEGGALKDTKYLTGLFSVVIATAHRRGGAQEPSASTCTPSTGRRT
jgi:type IV secretion system protein VirB5